MISTIPAREAVVNVALAMTWVKEIGANRGQAVEAILKRVYLAPGSPWCAAFVSYVGRAVLGHAWPLPMVGGCATLGDSAEERAMLLTSPEPGAIFLLYSEEKKRFNHTGFIAVASTPCFTVEGNTINPVWLNRFFSSE